MLLLSLFLQYADALEGMIFIIYTVCFVLFLLGFFTEKVNWCLTDVVKVNWNPIVNKPL